MGRAGRGVNRRPARTPSRAVSAGGCPTANLIAGTLAGLPWRVQRGSERLDDPAWIYDPMALRWDERIHGKVKTPYPAWQMSVVDFRTDWITSALWHGDGYIYAKVRDASGQPVPPIKVIHPHQIVIEGGRYFLRGGQTDVLFGTGTTSEVEIPAGDLIHLRGNPPYHNGHGSGVIDLHGAELGLAASVRSYAQGQFSSGVPTGYLKVNGTQPGTARSRSTCSRRSGWRRPARPGGRSIAVLNATTDFTPISLSPLDAQVGHGSAVVAAGHRPWRSACRRRPSSASRATPPRTATWSPASSSCGRTRC